MRVAVAMSGGIDSAVAAIILKRTHKIEGVFMQNWDARIEEGRHCTIEQDYNYAKRTADILKIPLSRVNFTREYWQNVFEPTIDSYSTGRTPNPDLLCNREIKFGKLLDWATSNNFDALATGHYARIAEFSGMKWMAQAKDLVKDQSYFLASVPQSKLNNCLFPTGEYASKDDVREIARKEGLEFLLEKPESMGICFVGNRRKFSHFLGEFITNHKGEIIEFETGKILGQHAGVESFTVGQGLRLGGMPSKLFVVYKCNSSHNIWATFDKNHPLLWPSKIEVECLDEELDRITDELTCSIRSADKIGTLVSSIEKVAPSRYVINLSQPIFAPAPGQAAVLYFKNTNGIRLVRACSWIA